MAPSARRLTREISVGGDSIGDALDRAAEAIRKSPAIDVWQEWQPLSDAELIMHEVAGTIDDDHVLNAAEAERFSAMVARRVAGEPVALVVGRIEFSGLVLETRPGVFVPRLSSELTVELAAARLRRRREAVGVDVATGAGPIALGMAAHAPAAEVWGLDIDPDAVALTEANASRLGLRNSHALQSDGLTALPKRLRGRVWVVTLHPPYVAAGELDDLPGEVREYEPAHTLTDRSDDGLGLARLVAESALEWLAPRGWLLLEVGPHLLRRTKSLMSRAGYRDIEWKRDETGATRVVMGRAPG